MPRLIFAPSAVTGLDRCRQFLRERNPIAARRAAATINESLMTLVTHPDIGRPLDPDPELREWPIPFGEAGYVALYRWDAPHDAVVVLAFRHQKEAGY